MALVVSLPGGAGSGGSAEVHGATIIVTTEEDDFVGQTVNLYYDDAIVQNQVFSSSKSVTFEGLLEIGTYTAIINYEDQDYSNEQNITMEDIFNNECYSLNINIVKIVTFSEGTDEEIAAMLAAHYAGSIDVADYWSVGDSRTVSLSAMSEIGGGTILAQDVELIIIGINHDNLTNGSGKAAITVQQKNCLNFNGYMNSTYTGITYARWASSERRTWCNNVYYNAIPEGLRSIIKVVNKVSVYATGTSTGNISTETSADKCFLVSNWEICAKNYSTYVTLSDGTQYDYYKTSGNRIKNVNSSACGWWNRTAFYASFARFMYTTTEGTQSYTNAHLPYYGIAPAFCL